jgi:hypothetical protein
LQQTKGANLMTEQLIQTLFEIRNQVRELGTAEAETIADFYMNYEEFLKKGSDAQVITTVAQSIRRMESALNVLQAGMNRVNQ